MDSKTSGRGVTHDEIIADLIDAADALGKNTITQKEYRQYGRYTISLLQARFGSWSKALNSAGLECAHHKVSDEEILSDIREIAHNLGVNTLSGKKYDSMGEYMEKTVLARFGTWNKALIAAGLETYSDQNISEESLMQNMLEVWIKLGKQPHFEQMHKPLSKYSTRPYRNKYITWRNTIAKFVEYVENDDMIYNTLVNNGVQWDPQTIIKEKIVKEKTNAGSTETVPQEHDIEGDPNTKVRFKAFNKDTFSGF